MRIRFAVLLLSASSLFAQTTTSVLTGRASNGDLALPGVSVTVESGALQGTRSTFTKADGLYVFPALPPGRYTVRFALDGMQPVAKTAELHLAETTRVDADLKPVLTAEVTVSPALATVLETPQVSSNYAQTFVRELPIGRGILDVARIAPGVHDNGPGRQLSINGAHSYENLYLVNGATISEPRRGSPHNLFIEDAIQETTIMTGGVSAEYGRFLGGVVSVITKSGGNQLSGTLRDTLSSDSWTAKTQFANEAEHLDRINHDYESTLGGRIVRDRLWFFLAGRYQQRRAAKETFLTFIPYSSGSNESRWEGKLTANLANNHTLVGSYLNVKAKELNASFSPVDLRALYNGETPNSLTAVSYTGILSSNAVIEAQFTRKYYAFTNYGSSASDPVFGSIVYDVATFASAWSPPFCADCPSEQRNNREVLLKGSLFLPNSRFGSHSVTMGATDFHEKNQLGLHQSGSDFAVLGNLEVTGDSYVLQMSPGETFITWAPILFPGRMDDYATTSAYINDRIDWGRHFAFNVGLRYDRSKGKDQLGADKMDDSRFSQRLSATYDLRGDGAHRFAASYSRYAGRILPGIGAASSVGGQPAYFYWSYEGPPINLGSGATVPTEEVLRRVFAWFESVGGTENTDLLLSKSFTGGEVIEGQLDAPVMDEWVAGYGRRFGRSGFARIDYVSRRWHDFYTKRAEVANGRIVDAVGNPHDKIIVENSNDGLKREYNGILLQGQYQRGRFTAGGNYTWSRLWGNVEAETAGQGAVSIPSPTAFFPEYTNYPQFAPMGYLNSDERNRANAWLSLDFPTRFGRFNTSVLQTFHTGRRYSIAANIDLRPFVQNPGYLNPPATSAANRYFFSDRGGLRLNDISSTSIAVNWARRFGRIEGFVETDVLNVFNNDEQEIPGSTLVMTSRNDRNLAPFNPFTTTPIECPQGVRTSDPSCRGIAHYQLPATFNVPLSKDLYQQPRTIRISLGVRF